MFNISVISDLKLNFYNPFTNYNENKSLTFTYYDNILISHFVFELEYKHFGKKQKINVESTVHYNYEAKVLNVEILELTIKRLKNKLFSDDIFNKIKSIILDLINLKFDFIEISLYYKEILDNMSDIDSKKLSCFKASDTFLIFNYKYDEKTTFRFEVDSKYGNLRTKENRILYDGRNKTFTLMSFFNNQQIVIYNNKLNIENNPDLAAKLLNCPNFRIKELLKIKES